MLMPSPNHGTQRLPNDDDDDDDDMATERRCTRPREVQWNNPAESYYEITRDDSGQDVA